MRIETTTYEWSHGKKPRGFGLWAFDLHLGGGKVETVFAPGYQSITTAKKWVKETVGLRRVRSIQVAP